MTPVRIHVKLYARLRKQAGASSWARTFIGVRTPDSEVITDVIPLEHDAEGCHFMPGHSSDILTQGYFTALEMGCVPAAIIRVMPDLLSTGSFGNGGGQGLMNYPEVPFITIRPFGIQVEKFSVIDYKIVRVPYRFHFRKSNHATD